MNVRALEGLAVADFRERVRRPAFVAILLAAVALGYAAVPPASANYSLLSVGGYRGEYDSTYVGMILALMGGLWLSFAGFYVVKNAVGRDDSTGVGQILAATPMTKVAYTLGKFLSNLMVLVALVAILALLAPVMQLLRGEAPIIHPFDTLLPFLLLPIPMLAITAAAAVLFETLRPLRGGLGNVVWFFGWLLFVGLAFANSAFDPLGFGAVSRTMRADLLAQHPRAPDPTLSAGLIVQGRPLKTFDWSGLEVTPDLLAGRLVLLALALGLVLLAALCFTRFDPSRAKPPVAAVTPGYSASLEVASATPTTSIFASPASRIVPAERGRAFAGLIAGEARILLRGVPGWWWLGSLALILVSLVVPADRVAFPMLPLAWVWPVLIWSRLGTQQYDHDVNLLVGSCPNHRRRLVAEWLAGLSLAAFAGLGALVRMGVASDWAGVAAWFGGLVFIPSLALALGVLGRSNRLFQAVYLMLWYLVMNSTAALDYMGAVREGGYPAGPGPSIVAGVAAAMLGAAFVVNELRHVGR